MYEYICVTYENGRNPSSHVYPLRLGKWLLGMVIVLMEGTVIHHQSCHIQTFTKRFIYPQIIYSSWLCHLNALIEFYLM